MLRLSCGQRLVLQQQQLATAAGAQPQCFAVKIHKLDLKLVWRIDLHHCADLSNGEMFLGHRVKQCHGVELMNGACFHKDNVRAYLSFSISTIASWAPGSFVNHFFSSLT